MMKLKLIGMIFRLTKLHFAVARATKRVHSASTADEAERYLAEAEAKLAELRAAIAEANVLCPEAQA